MRARVLASLRTYWAWAKHVDRATNVGDRRAGLWPPNPKAALGLNWGQSWRHRLWWGCVSLLPLGMVIAAGPLFGDPWWKTVVGITLIVVVAITAWKTARFVYGEAWEATRLPDDPQ